MGLFHKGGGDIIDFPMLQKRGIIKKEEIPPINNAKIDPHTGFIEFLEPSNITSNDLQVPSPSSNSSQTTDLLSFLDSSASISASSPSSFQSTQKDSLEMQSLKIKIDDLEFKLESLLEKISLLEIKFSGNS